ncbi:1-pyrroline-5-carboxylate dehydrogenase [Candidatus Sulfotelmatobacter kueseliae]|uniref:L-glutamate gamma-semialdehyde dehydrogenase n=1 Tax=Candidatus Sulfotelmatobacter kueseliae TaxID=2042962 RepID=A0A2U3L5X6_9BACT|nr:1-pyrroline-5-carboxylate dehydrogenase [Candidatus Sulfotelmatobacter kueseliae]
MATLEAPVRPRVSLHSGPFVTEPFFDFRNEDNARKMRATIAKVRGQLGREYDLIIGGKRVKTAEKIKSLNPAKPSEIVGIHQKAGKEQVEPAMKAALAAFESWRSTTVEERASLLFRVGDLLRQRKMEFMAWMVFEVSKNWAEADADVSETLDFCEFYAREALRLAKTQLPIQLPGERDTLTYIPLGVGAVIPPWNFPCAIMAGMTLASIVSGNTVILKPSSDSPTIAAKFIELLEEAGMPEGVVNFCPGAGASFGDAIVAHPKTRYIAFTGSREVGLRINQVAANQAPGQIWIKRTILEMGGKDAIVVDADADVDSAVEGVAQAAFGFQGQKCSACSRAIVDERIYDKFLEQLKARVEKIQIGDPTENANLAAVINESSMKTILQYIEQGKKDGRILTGGERAPGEGYFIQPTVIADIPPKSKLEQEEIFGPVLVVIKARGFDHALEIANDTEFGLTGAVYTSSRDKAERAIRDFHVGNLYINRKCTGAMVGAHPFGGFNMSGTDSKSGGPDYLYLFTQAKAVGEKIG